MKNIHYLCNQKNIKGLLMVFVKVKILELTLCGCSGEQRCILRKQGTYGVLMRWNKESQIGLGEGEHSCKMEGEEDKEPVKKSSFQELRSPFSCLGLELSSQALKGRMLTFDCIICKCSKERVNISRYEWLHIIDGVSKSFYLYFPLVYDSEVLGYLMGYCHIKWSP